MLRASVSGDGRFCFCLLLLVVPRAPDCLHGQSLSVQSSRNRRFSLHELQDLIFVALELVHIVTNDEHDVVTFTDGLKPPMSISYILYVAVVFLGISSNSPFR